MPDPGASLAPSGKHPTVVVTGASRGIGRAIAERFAVNGHDVLLIARTPGPLEAAAGEIRRKAPAVRVTTLALDIGDHDAPHRIDADLAAADAHLDLLVNNAASGVGGAFDRQSDLDIDDLVALNIAALTRLMRHALPGMIARRRGAIINIASLGGYTPGPYQAAYYASKAYVISLSEAVAHEVSGSGVLVAAVVPGPVETSFHAAMGAERAPYRRLMPSLSPEAVARSVYRGYRLRLRIIRPGLINCLLQPALRLVPHPFLVPIVGWLLRPPQSH